MPAQSSPTHGDPADAAALNAASPTPMPKTVLCPYCGHISFNTQRCDGCRGFFDPLSRQASQNSMGPWYIRDEAIPYRPGCSYDTLRLLVHRGKVTRETVLRGPSTRQFWAYARSTPGVANLLGECHSCHAAAEPTDAACPSCSASFACETDRQYVGLSPVHLLPGHSSPEVIAASTYASSAAQVVSAPRLNMPQPAAPAAYEAPRLTPALDRIASPGSRRRDRHRGPAVAVVLGVVCVLLLGIIAALLTNPRFGVRSGVGAPSGALPTVTQPATPTAAAPVAPVVEGPAEPAPGVDADVVPSAPEPNEGPDARAPAENPARDLLAKASELLRTDDADSLADAGQLLEAARASADDATSAAIENYLRFLDVRRAQLRLRERL